MQWSLSRSLFSVPLEVRSSPPTPQALTHAPTHRNRTASGSPPQAGASSSTPPPCRELTPTSHLQSPVITELALYDIVPVVKGVAADISHVDTPSIVTGYSRDDDGLKLALTGAQIVVIPAGVPRKVSRRFSSAFLRGSCCRHFPA